MPVSAEHLAALEAQLAALQKTVREQGEAIRALTAMKQGPRGEPGRDGKDGRDGRDGKSVNPRQISAMIKSVQPRTVPPANIYVEPNIVVQPSEVILEASISAPSVDNHVHVDGLERMAEIAERTAHEIVSLRDTMQKPMRPVYDERGKLVGGERVETL